MVIKGNLLATSGGDNQSIFAGCIYWLAKAVPFKYCYLILLGLFLLVLHPSKAQEVTVKLGSSTVNIADKFSITLQSKGIPLEQYGSFPEIAGFSKYDISSNTFTQNIDGENTTIYSFIQLYTPLKPGIFTIPPFKVKANGKTISHPGGQVTVTDEDNNIPEQDAQPSSTDVPLPPISGPIIDDIANLDPKGAVFFALSTDKKEVFVREGFTATLALYVADNNTQELDFYNVAEQLQAIAQLLKPSNCWEENFGITEIQEIPVKIKGRKYSQFKIYQATYYPLNTDPVTFPAVGLKMLTNTQALAIDESNPRNFKVYNAQGLTVKVRDIPEHPLKGSVSVGQFRLEEFLNRTKLQTGKSFTYKFSIRGEGNISAINAPEIPPGLPFDIFRPNDTQNIFRSVGRVTGERTFSYNIIPQEAGKFNLSDGFYWVFFNTATRKYDTLTSKYTVRVSGESQEPTDIFGGTADPFYADMKERNNTLKRLDRNRIWKEYANWTIAGLFLVFVVVFFVDFKKGKPLN